MEGPIVILKWIATLVVSGLIGFAVGRIAIFLTPKNDVLDMSKEQEQTFWQKLLGR